MTTVHAQLVSGKAVLSQAEFERLIELAQRSEEIEVQVHGDNLPTWGIMRLAEQGGAFNWLADEEDLYTVDDLKVRYR